MKLVFIILIYTVVKAQDSVSKYIDLLPEEEKDAFLDRIARRILAEVPVSNNSHPRTSVELLDDQLKEHDEFVNKILKEETQNLRKSESANNGTESKNDAKSDVRTYVDLTMRTDHRTKREDNRRVYTGYSPDNDNSAEQENGNDSDVKEDIQVKNFRRSKEEPTANDEKEENTQNATHLNSETSSQATFNIEDNVRTKNERNNAIESIQDDQKHVKINNTDTSKKLIEMSITSIKNIVSVGNTDNTSESSTSKSAEFSTIKEVNSDIANPETTTETTMNFNDKKPGKDEPVKNLEDSKVIHLEITSATEAVTVSDTEFPITTKSNIVTSTLKPDDDINQSSYLTMATMKVITTTPSPIVYVNSNVKINEKQSVPSTKTQKFSNKKNENTVNDKETSKVSINLEYSAPKLLRQKLNNNKEAEHFKSLKSEYDINQNKVYKIYEISPDAAPFVKLKSPKANVKPKPKPTRKPKPVEQPYYVPIYKYSPNNAFYNPYNIFGPNGDSDIEKQSYGSNDDENDGYMSDIGNKYKHNNIKVKHKPINIKNVEWDYYDPLLRKFRFVGPNDKKPNTAEPYKIKLPVNADKPKSSGKYNLNDYLDIDYSGRANKEAISRARHHKDCSSNSETSESVESTTKYQENHDSVRFIRKLLLEKKVFSSIKPIQIVSTPDPDFANYSVTKAPENKHNYLRMKKEKSYKHRTYDSKNIAANYYYGGSRINSKEEVERVEDAKIYNKSDFHIPLLTYQIKINKNNNNSTGSTTSLENVSSNDQNLVPPIEKNEVRPNENDNTDYDLIKKILTIVPLAEVMPTLKKLLTLNLKKKTTRSKANNEINVFANVLEDMVRGNNRALVQYNWLETTVDLLSASKKLEDLIVSFHDSESMHPSDLELLKYLVYIHAMAKEELLEGIMGKELRAILLPRNKKRKKEFIKEKGLLQRVWLVRMTEQEMQIPDDDLEELEEFLADLQNALYDLHTALKYISMVTTFKNQYWFEDLKQVRVGTNRKQILQIILHLCTSRLLALVEESARNGLEDGYLSYIKQNEKEFNRTKEEFVFVLKLLDEIKSMK